MKAQGSRSRLLLEHEMTRHINASGASAVNSKNACVSACAEFRYDVMNTWKSDITLPWKSKGRVLRA